MGLFLHFCVLDFHPFGTQVMTTLQNNATVVNDTFNVTCTAEANPPAEYMIYKDDMSLINITSHPAVHETSVTERVNQARYKCVPFNSFGPGREKEITITVHCKYVMLRFHGWLLSTYSIIRKGIIEVVKM